MKNEIVKNDLFDYKNRFIYQFSKGFKFSLDSVLLAEFIEIKLNNKLYLDLCTGNAAIPLILSKYTNSKIVGFEIQKEIFDLANLSVKENNLEEQIYIINDDINNIFNYYSKNYFDVIFCNPPYFRNNDTSLINSFEMLAIARHELYLNLEQIFSLTYSLLKDKGVFYMVHRAERIDEIIILAYKYKLNVKTIQFISTKHDKKPTLILVKCVKNSAFGVIIKPVVNVENLKSYQNIFRK